jgi:hypothetical protein
MGKSYRRHHKRPKRKHSRRRKGGVDGNVPKSSFSMSDMSKHLNNAYDSGVKAAQPHVEKMGNMVTDLHKQAKDSGNKLYKGFKYSSPTNFAIAKSGESAYSTASKSMQPHYDKMKSSMGSMGSSMGFSSLSTKTPNVKELQHAQEESSMGVPTAFSQTSQTSAL